MYRNSIKLGYTNAVDTTFAKQGWVTRSVPYKISYYSKMQFTVFYIPTYIKKIYVIILKTKQDTKSQVKIWSNIHTS